MAVALSKTEARAALHGARLSWNQQGELRRREARVGTAQFSYGRGLELNGRGPSADHLIGVGR
jgi:hypothetical protein